jgi:hypothetical protein
MPKNTKLRKSGVSKRPAQQKNSRSPRDLRQLERLLSQLPDLKEVLRGSLVTRYRRCGHSNCHCARKGDRGHGPAYYLVVTVASGKTAQVYVPKEQKREVEAWIENFRRVREILESLSTANRKLLKQGKLFKGG